MPTDADECRQWQAEAAKELGSARAFLELADPMRDPDAARGFMLDALKKISAAGGSLAAYDMAKASQMQGTIEAVREQTVRLK